MLDRTEPSTPKPIIAMPIVNRVADLQPDIQAWRRDIHEHPELQYDVHRTAALVAERLREFGCDEVATVWAAPASSVSSGDANQPVKAISG
jgi:metal-dependent amidase/aminoacylase/carboxypeptidase family protein